MKKEKSTEKQELRMERMRQKETAKQERAREKAKRKAQKESSNAQMAVEKAAPAIKAKSLRKEAGEKKSFWDRFKQTKLFDYLWIMNPQNLSMEVHVYGYNFSWKSHVASLICSVIGISAIGLIFKLNSVFLMLNIIAVIFMIPNIVRYMYRQMYEQKRFADVTTYMEQMLYSFQKSQKILSSLRETRQLFETGRMSKCIDQAIAYIEEGKTTGDGGVLKEGLACIEDQYECAKLLTVHELLINSEEYGGDNDNSIVLLLNDIGVWKKHGYVMQANKKLANTKNIISIVFSTAICALILFILELTRTAYFDIGEVESVSMYKIGIIQVSSIAFLIAMMSVLMKSLKSLTVNWLNEEALTDESVIEHSYNTVVNYDEERTRKKSIFIALPFVILSVVAFAYQINWAGILLLGVSIFALKQYKIGYNLAMKNVTNALYTAMPQWFMQLALLLQHNNVTVAMAKSIETAPVVLRHELEEMMIRLSEAPEALTSYTDFCKNFDVPEIQSCMKMLHSMSVSGVGNSEKQINNLIERVNEMQAQADIVRDKQMAFKMYMIFKQPASAAAVKLLVDLSVGIVYMFSLLGTVGARIGGM